jgi:mannose-1-phosphate guanylyltransferase
VRAVVLVGGKGTRLRPLTLVTPKQMLPVGGRPMIERVVEHLARHGIDDVVLSLGFRPDAFRSAYPDGRCSGVTLRYAVEDHPLDTAGAIAFAADAAGIDETFVVVNGDVLSDVDVSALVAFHRARKAGATLHLTPVEDPSRFGVVPTDPDGRVVAFIEKPAPGQAPTNLINAGTYVLEPAVVAHIPRDRPVSVERETFPALVEAGVVYAMPGGTEWLDAGTPATYLAANLRYASAVDPGDGVDASASVRTSVLGDGVRVGAGAEVSGSLVMAGATVGAGACVEGSIVGPGATVGDRACVRGLSVLGEGVAVPPGAVLDGALVPDPTR